MLKGGRRIAKTYGNEKIFVQTVQCEKGTFRLIAFAYTNLMVSMAKVDRSDYCCLAQPVKQVRNTWYGEHIEPRLMVETAIINTHE